jgi:hypothetical protein
MDSDMTLENGLLSELDEKFNSNPEVGAYIIPEIDISTGYWSKCKALERSCYYHNSEIESARAVFRNIFLSVRGYDEKIRSGEDFYINSKYKKITKIGRTNHHIFHHLLKRSFWEYVYKKYIYGKYSLNYLHTDSKNGWNVIYEEAHSYWKNRYRLLANPIYFVGMCVLKLGETMALLGGIWLSSISEKTRGTS